VPTLDTAAKAFGSIYVMEGATLGGQIITRHVKEHLDLTPENGGAFFNSYGPMVGPMWKGFGTAITAFAEKADADDEIVDSAKETFDAFRESFVQPV
jgi:heme oxygenase